MRSNIQVLADAVERLRTAFQLCGLQVPEAIVVKPGQLERIGAMMASGAYMVRDESVKRTAIVGVELVEMPPPPPPPRRPAQWEVGMRVRYLRNQEWGPSKGALGTIIGFKEGDEGRPADAYQVFYVRADSMLTSQFWTTPEDVELVEEEAGP